MAMVNMVQPIDTIATVYNFEVEKTHNYYVGTEGVLVHNANYDITILKQVKSAALLEDEWVAFSNLVNKTTTTTSEITIFYRELSKLNDANLKAFYNDFKAGDLAFQRATIKEIELIDIWKSVSSTNKLRNSVNFLRIVQKIKANSALKNHINFGEIKVTVKDSRNPLIIIREEKYLPGGGSQLTSGQSASVKVSGFHNENNLGTFVFEVPGTRVPVGTLPDGTIIYKAEIQFKVKELDTFNPNGTIKTEGIKNKVDPSTFFPKSWSDEKISEVISEAYQNAVFTGRKWEGITAEGVKIEGYVDDITTKNITSAYIIF